MSALIQVDVVIQCDPEVVFDFLLGQDAWVWWKLPGALDAPPRAGRAHVIDAGEGADAQSAQRWKLTTIKRPSLLVANACLSNSGIITLANRISCNKKKVRLERELFYEGPAPFGALMRKRVGDDHFRGAFLAALHGIKRVIESAHVELQQTANH